MKVISAKFLNEFLKLVEQYEPDRELNKMAELSKNALTSLTGEETDKLVISASLLNVASMESMNPKRKAEIMEFNCKAYALIHDKPLEEVEEMDYKAVVEDVSKFRSENK